MPTGYTAKLMEKGQSFPEFVQTCARAFGALVMMRDDGLDTPIPEKFEPSDYYAKRIEEELAELDRLTKMSKADQIAFGNARRESELERLREAAEREAGENSRIDAMLKEVEAWTPPSPDHVGMKKFMTEQLTISRHEPRYLRERIAEQLKKSPQDYYDEALATARRVLAYSRQEQVKEIERTEQRNEWVRQLRESLKPVPGN